MFSLSYQISLSCYACVIGKSVSGDKSIYIHEYMGITHNNVLDGK